jgi:hypothetical protein
VKPPVAPELAKENKREAKTAGEQFKIAIVYTVFAGLQPSSARPHLVARPVLCQG